MSNKGRILVIRGGAIGDFILTLPVLSALRRQFPAADLELLAYPKVAQLALADGLATGVRSIEAQSLAGFFARNGDLSAELSEYFSRFQIVISYLYDPDEVFQENVKRCFNGQFIQGPHRPDERETVHATEVFLKPLERLAIFDADPVPRLPNLRQDKTSPNRIAFHPGSGSETKNWPESKWKQLLARLAVESRFEFLMIGGEADEPRVRHLQNALPPERLKPAINLPLHELAQQLAQCSFFLGHDSGITHLAAALEMRGLVLWGPSNETIWRPRHENMKILRSPGGLEHLEVNAVLESFYNWIR